MNIYSHNEPKIPLADRNTHKQWTKAGRSEKFHITGRPERMERHIVFVEFWHYELVIDISRNTQPNRPIGAFSVGQRQFRRSAKCAYAHS